MYSIYILCLSRVTHYSRPVDVNVYMYHAGWLLTKKLTGHLLIHTAGLLICVRYPGWKKKCNNTTIQEC